jgi:hypothetical protein
MLANQRHPSIPLNSSQNPSGYFHATGDGEAV